MGYSFIFLVCALIVQVILSYLFMSIREPNILMTYIDISKLMGWRRGQLRIYYSDMVRVGSFVLLLIPYMFMLTKSLNKTVAKPLNSLAEELTKIDYSNLEERLSLSMKYEFLTLEKEFNGLLERLQKATDDRNKSEAEKDLLISGIAHDLKTPITTIRGYSQVLSDGILENELQKLEYIKSINQKAIQLDEMITLLFDYVRLGTSQYELFFEEVDIVEIIKTNLALYYTEFEEKGIEVRFDLPDTPIIISADNIQLNRVFSNIYSNALKYNSRGDAINTAIYVNEKITIAIEDTGEIIPENISNSIFDPFVMGDYSRKNGSGNGLGLSIAFKIIALHNGRIFLEQGKNNQYTKSFMIEFEK